MQYKSRSGELLGQVTMEDRMFRFLYQHRFVAPFVKLLTCPVVSRLGGWFLSTRLSSFKIDSFVRKNKVDLSDCIPKRYRSFNDFFTRKIRPTRRPIDWKPEHLISPCDGKATIIPLTRGKHLTIKNVDYTLQTLLKNERLAEQYADGTAILLRLGVNDYHRYCYLDNAKKEPNHTIRGFFHTVNPVVAECKSIYSENNRSWCLLHTENFGQVLHMEVGALMVGKIHNLHGKRAVLRGQEKGYFMFGGSSILLLFQKGCIEADADLVKNSNEGYETAVRMGERIGQKKKGW